MLEDIPQKEVHMSPHIIELQGIVLNLIITVLKVISIPTQGKREQSIPINLNSEDN